MFIVLLFWYINIQFSIINRKSHFSIEIKTSGYLFYHNKLLSSVINIETYFYFQSLHFNSGFILLPTGQLYASANPSEF